MKTISVIGCGYVGLPTALVLADAGYTVCGVDTNKARVDALSGGKMPFYEQGMDELLEASLKNGNLSFSTMPGPSDVFIICVQTPCIEKDGGEYGCDISYVHSAANMVGAFVSTGNLIILESTSPPGTSREVADIVSKVSGLPKSVFMTAHCPERVVPGNTLKELRENDRVIGGTCPEATEAAKSLYQPILTKGAIITTDDLTAELGKLAENTYRDINIAFANELSVICDKLGIDVFGLISTTNCHPRVNIHTPGVGVGGHCVPIVPWFIHEKFPDDSKMIVNARRINDNKPFWVADKVEKEAAGGAKIAVLGMTYKADTDDLRDSASVVFAGIMRSRGFEVYACEPNCGSDVLGYVNLALDEALEKCDYLVITLAHKEFKAQKEKIAQKPHYDCTGLLSVNN